MEGIITTLYQLMLPTRSQNTVHCNCLHFRDTIGYHSNNMTTYNENTLPEEGQTEVFSGSQRGGPWSPGALKFLLWSPEPDHFTDWSPDTFLAVEPGAQRSFARSPEPSIFNFDHSSSQIASILDCRAFLCFFVRVNGHKETRI